MFSERENLIIKIVGHKQLSLAEVSEKLFKGTKLLDSNIAVANSVRRIIHKCEFYKLPWTFKKTRVDNQLMIQKFNK